MQLSSGTNSNSSEKSNPSSGEAASALAHTAPHTVETSPATTASSPASTSQPTTVEDDEEWTEVVHSSGQLYYWNQRTGETTQLGEPKPQYGEGSGGGSGSNGGGGSSGGTGSSGGKGGSSEGAAHDPRAEAPMEDRTGTYAALGIVTGAFLGWVSQFL